MCSVIGFITLSLQYGFGILAEIPAGAHKIERQFANALHGHNFTVIKSLLGKWNSTFSRV